MEPRLCRSKRENLPPAPRRRRRRGGGTSGVADSAGKKTAAAIQQEVAQEIEQLLAVIFAARRKNHRWDLEALETATRAALHQAGAKLLEQLLEAPLEAEPEQPCHCGRRARHRGRRPKKMLTVLGEVEIERPYYLCGACHQGQFRFDREIDVADTQYSPGVRRHDGAGGQRVVVRRWP